MSEDRGALWLVRHGESTWNALGLVQGHSDGPVLSETGRAQSARAAELLRGLMVDALYASDLARAWETATIIGGALGVPAEAAPGLRERCLGAREGSSASALVPAETGIDGNRVVNAYARPPGGESLDELYRRTSEFLGQLTPPSPGRAVILVSHGGPIRTLRALCEGVPTDAMPWHDVPNASLWRVEHPALRDPAQH